MNEYIRNKQKGEKMNVLLYTPGVKIKNKELWNKWINKKYKIRQIYKQIENKLKLCLRSRVGFRIEIGIQVLWNTTQSPESMVSRRSIREFFKHQIMLCDVYLCIYKKHQPLNCQPQGPVAREPTNRKRYLGNV